MIINLVKLETELTAAGLAITGLAVLKPEREIESHWSVYIDSDGTRIRVDFVDTPPAGWETTVGNVVAVHDPVDHVQDAQSGLLDKVALAEQFAPSIKTLFNTTLTQTETQSAQPARFDAINAVLDAAPVAFRTRFNTDLLEETGLDILVILPTITNAQRRTFCLFARVWVTQLGLLLSWHK